MLFEVGCGNGQDGRECLPASLFFKLHIKDKLIILRDKGAIIIVINSNKVSIVINFIQAPERHLSFEMAYNQTSTS